VVRCHIVPAANSCASLLAIVGSAATVTRFIASYPHAQVWRVRGKAFTGAVHCLLLSGQPLASTQGIEMIEFAQLQEMFANIAADAKWDMGSPMRWGYFFADGSAEKLQGIVYRLEQQGYRFVDLFPGETGEGEEQYFVLHVEKEEVHSALSLHERNIQLDAFAGRHALDAYDGMDVGPIAQP
jgi:hypothetical protein